MPTTLSTLGSKDSFVRLQVIHVLLLYMLICPLSHIMYYTHYSVEENVGRLANFTGSFLF